MLKSKVDLIIFCNFNFSALVL